MEHDQDQTGCTREGALHVRCDDGLVLCMTEPEARELVARTLAALDRARMLRAKAGG